MKSYLLILLAVFTLFSCNKDEESQTNADFTVNGKFLAPNNVDPISNAKIKVFSNAQLKGETTTDAQGNYSLALNAGTYDMVLSKGKFKTEKQITVEADLTLDNFSVEILPSIGVVTGYYDNIESVLYSIGLFDPLTGEPLFDIIEGNDGVSRIAHTNHLHQQHANANRTETNPLLEPNVDFNFGDLMDDETLLSNYDILFLNCGLSEALQDDSGVLENYVNNGGILYATDWASVYLDAITDSGANYITPYTPAKSGISTNTVATILEGNLSEWLLINYGISIDDTVEIDDFLFSWQVIDSYDSSTTISWLNGPVSYLDDTDTEISENKDLAFTFLHGSGAVLYSSFHTENNQTEDFSDVDRIMQFLVFEMSDNE